MVPQRRTAGSARNTRVAHGRASGPGGDQLMLMLLIPRRSPEIAALRQYVGRKASGGTQSGSISEPRTRKPPAGAPRPAAHSQMRCGIFSTRSSASTATLGVRDRRTSAKRRAHSVSPGVTTCSRFREAFAGFRALDDFVAGHLRRARCGEQVEAGDGEAQIRKFFEVGSVELGDLDKILRRLDRPAELPFEPGEPVAVAHALPACDQVPADLDDILDRALAESADFGGVLGEEGVIKTSRLRAPFA